MKIKTLVNPIRFAQRLMHKIYELRHPDEPWITPGAVRFCSEHLDKEQTGLEWGSGRSTVWIGKRLKSLVSVEHNEKWFSIVKDKLENQSLHNVDYRYVPLDHDASEPTIPHYEELPAYVRVARKFDDETLDFVVVDGHYRQACILAVIPKIKTGGLLLVDNTNWLPLAEWQVPPTWPIVHQSRYVTMETTVWTKPQK